MRQYLKEGLQYVCCITLKEYEARRDFVIQMLSDVGFQISFKPQGSFFVFAELPKNWLVSDVGDIACLLVRS